jgi:hypothetical protein
VRLTPANDAFAAQRCRLLLGQEQDVVAKAGVSADLDEMASLPEREVITSGGKTRVDPAPAPLDAVLSQGQLTNKDAKKHYVWVSKTGDPTFNLGTYMALGYKIEKYAKAEPDQTRPTLGWQEYEDGDPIEAMACTLVSCSMEHKRMLDARGQAQVDERQDKLRSRAHVQPLSTQERHDYRHIEFEPHGGDNRPSWE